MTRKNPDNKPLRIVYTDDKAQHRARVNPDFSYALSQLAVAQAILARHKSSAMPHFIAIVKELENIHGFNYTFGDLRFTIKEMGFADLVPS